MKLIQKVILIPSLVLISYLAFILRHLTRYKAIYLSELSNHLLGRWILTTCKNKTIKVIAIIVLINIIDLIFAAAVGVIIGFIMKRNAKSISFFIIAGSYIIESIIVIKNEIYYGSFDLYLANAIMILLSIIFVFIGATIGIKGRKAIVKFKER